MRSLIAGAAVVLLTTGCGGDGEPAAEPAKTVTVEPSGTPNAATEAADATTPSEAVSKVDNAVICSLLFEVKGASPIASLIRLWDKDSPTVAELDRLTQDAEQMESVAERAQEPLASHLRDFAQIQREYVATAYGEYDVVPHDRTDLQAAGFSITEVCEGV